MAAQGNLFLRYTPHSSLHQKCLSGLAFMALTGLHRACYACSSLRAANCTVAPLLTLLLSLESTFLLLIPLPDLEKMVHFLNPNYQLHLLSSFSGFLPPSWN